MSSGAVITGMQPAPHQPVRQHLIYLHKATKCTLPLVLWSKDEGLLHHNRVHLSVRMNPEMIRTVLMDSNAIDYWEVAGLCRVGSKFPQTQTSKQHRPFLVVTERLCPGSASAPSSRIQEAAGNEDEL